MRQDLSIDNWNKNNIRANTWVKSDEYWDIYFDLTENIKKSFDSEGISIPFPQRNVHMYEHKEK